MATRIIYVKLKRKIDLARRDDATLVRRAAELSSDGTFHYVFKRTAFSDEQSWRDRFIISEDGLADSVATTSELQTFSAVAEVVSYLDYTNNEDLGIAGNPTSFRCQQVSNDVASTYWKVANVWPAGYDQGHWDSSALVCFNYLVAVNGTSSVDCITGLVDSTVTIVTRYHMAKWVGDLSDSTHYVDRIVTFPTRETAPFHSLERFRVSGAEARWSGNDLYVALELCNNNVARTPLTSPNALENLGISSGYGSNPTNSMMVSGLCQLLHWSADSSDALCTNADYEDGEEYVPAAPQRSDALGWNTDAFQSGDSTVNTGFFFDGLTSYPVSRSRMAFGTYEGNVGLLWHWDFGGINDSTNAVLTYNAGQHPKFQYVMRQLNTGIGSKLDLSYLLARGPLEDWSAFANAHQGQVHGIVAGSWNESGTVGVAPGAKIDPETWRSSLYEAADTGAVDVVSYSLTSSYENDFGPLYYYDVVGDRYEIPVGSVENSPVFSYLNDANVWMIVPPFGNQDDYICFDTEIPTIGAISAWDGSSAIYNYGEATDFVIGVPIIAPSRYWDPSASAQADKVTYQSFAGQSSSTPAGAAHFLLLKERRPEIDLMEAKQLFAYSCRKYNDMTGAVSTWHPRYGYGRPDIVVAAATDLTAAGCPPPKGLIVDGEGTGYASLRWNNPHYRNFVKTKILRKRTDSTNSYRTFTINYGKTLTDNYPSNHYAEQCEWNDVIMMDAEGIADLYDTHSDSTYLGKMTIYLDWWMSGHGYISDYDHVNHADGFSTTHNDIVPGPGDSTHGFFYTTGQPKVMINWAPGRKSPGYVIDSTGMHYGMIVDKLTDICKKFYDEGTPLYGIFMDEWYSSVLGKFNGIYVLKSTAAGESPDEGVHTDRNGSQNDSSSIFILHPQLWSYYVTHTYHTVNGLEWGQMTKLEQGDIESQYLTAIPYQQMLNMEGALNSIVENYCVPDGRVVLNGSFRRLTTTEPRQPYYARSSRLFEGAGTNHSDSRQRWPTLRYYSSDNAAYYCNPNDFIITYNKGASGDWNDWHDIWNGTEADAIYDTEQGSKLAYDRGAFYGCAFGETPYYGGTILSYAWNPGHVDDRWPFYVSNKPYMVNHTDGTVVYQGPRDFYVDQPGIAGNYIYTAFSQNRWGDWSLPGIGFSQALKRKYKTTLTVDSFSESASTVSIYGTISPSGSTFLDGATTKYNDSTVVPPIGDFGLPHGQGWYLIGDSAKKVYPITKVFYDSDGKFSYVRCDSDEVDISTLSAGDELEVHYLSLTVGNNSSGAYPVRTVWEQTFPREAVTLAASGVRFTSFDPYVDATIAFDANSQTSKMYFRNVRNPSGIKDIRVYKYNGVPDNVNQFPLFPTYYSTRDSTSLSIMVDRGPFQPFSSYKIVLVGVNNAVADPIYIYGVPTNPIDPPPIVLSGFYYNFAPIIKISNPNPTNVSFKLRKNGVDYIIGSIGSGSTVDVFDLFWVEGDSYSAVLSSYGYDSNSSGDVTPSISDLPSAKTNIDILDERYIIPLGDSTYSEYADAQFQTVYRTATNRLGTFQVGQFVWPGASLVLRYKYRTDVVPKQYGGPGEYGVPPQFEFWNSQSGGSMLLRFEANPIEFEFDFGIRHKRIAVLDGPDKVQLLYQDHTLRSMLWRSIPLHKYRRFISNLKRFIGQDVWLDSKDFTMPIRGQWPFTYAAGYRYKINIVDIVVKPVNQRGTQRADIELKYKLLTTEDGSV